MSQKRRRTSEAPADARARKSTRRSAGNEDIESDTEILADLDELLATGDGERRETIRQSTLEANLYNPERQSKGPLGSLKSINLINFMCHTNFIIEFGPNVNFVLGQNGSGKSAILNGIIVGLGSRAATTNRGNSMKSFIKNGCNFARVIIRICNYNPEDPSSSFKYEIYGKEIIIQRTIKESSSTYSIRNSKDKEVSNKKDELNSIIKYFRMQIDNPVCLLNQEISRNFLNSKVPKDKYEFFARATGIYDLKNNYDNAMRQVERAIGVRDRKEVLLPEVQQEVKKLGKQVEMLQSIEEYKIKETELAKELIWSKVVAKEVEIEQLDDQISDLKLKLDEASASIEKYRSKTECFAEERGALQDDFDSLNNELQSLTQESRNLSNQIDQLEDKKKEKERERKSAIQQRDILIEDIKCQESDLRVAMEKIGQHIVEEDKLKRQEEIRKLEQEKSEVELNFERTKKELEERNLRTEKLHEEMDECRNVMRNCESSIRNHKQVIGDLEGSQANSLKIFGKFVPELVNRIESEFRAGKFSHKPVGPIGHYIKLKDRSCSSALQAALKNLVYGFVCDNVTDMSHLQKLIDDVTRGTPGAKPQVIARKFSNKRHDISRNIIVDDEYKSFVDLISVSDINVFNTIIDKTQLETVAFIPNSNDARDTLLNIRSVPTNCLTSYSSDGTQCYATTKRSTFRMYPSDNRSNYRDIFPSDIASDVSFKKKEISRLESEILKIKGQGVEAHNSFKENEERIKFLKPKLAEYKRSRVALYEQIQQLKAIKDPEPAELDTLKEELDENRGCLDAEKLKIGRLTKEVEDIESKIADERSKLKELKTKEKEKVAQRTKLSKEMADMDTGRDKFQTYINKGKQEAMKLETELKKKKSECEALKQVRLERINEARVVCDKRIKTTRSPEELSTELQDLRFMISETEEQAGDKEEVTAMYEEASARLEQVEAIVVSVKECIKIVKKKVEGRRDYFYSYRSHIGDRVNEEFGKCLEKYDFSGHLEICHNSQPDESMFLKNRIKNGPYLNMKINPRSNMVGEEQFCNDTRSLSGGERSYTTAAFLLALWEGSNTPFKILDEVDVFMDMLTREKAMDALIEAAINDGGQFIFLSPLQLIQKYTGNDYIKIHRLEKAN